MDKRVDDDDDDDDEDEDENEDARLGTPITDGTTTITQLGRVNAREGSSKALEASSKGT